MYTLEKISERAQSIIKGQIESYRAVQTKAGTVLGAISIFIPLFTLIPITKLELLELSKILSFVTAGIGSILMIIILVHRKLLDGYNEKEFNNIVNFDEKEFLQYEIEISLTCIEENDVKMRKMDRIYRWGLSCFVSSLIVIISIYSINSFTIMAKDKKESKSEKKPATIEFKKQDVSKTRHIVGMVEEEKKPDAKKD